MLQGIEKLVKGTIKVVEITNLEEIGNVLRAILFVPDRVVRDHIINELVSYLRDKMQVSEYKIKVFVAYQQSEVCGFVISQIDPYYKSYSRRCGTFGWLHANDFTTCQKLINCCEKFMKANKLRKIRGNINFPKNLGGVGIQVMGFEEQMLYGVSFSDPQSKMVEYLTRLGYKNESEYTCVYVSKRTWKKGKRIDNNIRLSLPTIDELYSYTDEILKLADGSFYQVLPDSSGEHRILEVLEDYKKLPKSFYKINGEFVPENHSSIPEFLTAWKSCDIEKVQPYVPMAFDKKTGDLVGIIMCLPDLFQVMKGVPVTRVNVDTAMVKEGYYGKGIFSALNNIGQLTCLIRGMDYFEGTTIWSNNTHAIDTIFPHCNPIRKHNVLQKRIKIGDI